MTNTAPSNTSSSRNALDFAKLSRGAQILLAYILYEQLDDVQLLKSDPDGTALFEGGWLQEKKDKIHGVVIFELTSEGSDKLNKIEERVLSSISEDELDSYKGKKNTYYPWLW